MNKYWIVVRDRETSKTWYKYFENEKVMNNYINKIKFVKNLFIIEDSRDIVYN